jgi:hypothetical protein
MKEILVAKCYEAAGEDPIESGACDLFEHDAIKLLWHMMNFTHLIEFNENKYTFIYGRMNKHVFSHIIEAFVPIKEAFDDLMEEMDALRDATLIRIERLIDSKTKDIMNMHDIDSSFYLPKLLNYKTTVVQTIGNLAVKPLTIANLPHSIKLDGSNNLFDDSKDSHHKEKWYKGMNPNPQPWDQEAFKVAQLHQDHAKLVKDLVMGYGEHAPKETISYEDLDNALGGGPVNGTQHEAQEFDKDMHSAEHVATDIPGHFYDGYSGEEYKTRKLRSVKRKHLM